MKKGKIIWQLSQMKITNIRSEISNQMDVFKYHSYWFNQMTTARHHVKCQCVGIENDMRTLYNVIYGDLRFNLISNDTYNIHS